MEPITEDRWIVARTSSPNDLDTTTEFMGSYVNGNGDNVYWTQVDTPEFEYVYRIVPREWHKEYYMGSK
jgi:hypothetical protein